MKKFIFLPFSLCLASFLMSCKTIEDKSSIKYQAGEHLLIGNRAYDFACKDADLCSDRIPRQDGNVTYTYGEIVAFSGDFYQTPQEFYEETTQRNVFSPFANDISKAKDLFAQEVDAIEDRVKNNTKEYPDFNISFVLAYPRYLELANNNTAHFGWHNMKAYVRYHSQALALALQARADQKNGARLFKKALFFNAFADHFLSDGFAAGHVRVPRAQSLKWQQEKGYGQRAISALAKVLHDGDHPAEVDGGLPVTNARGDIWKTLGDGSLYGTDDTAARMVTEALEISIQEVLNVYDGKAPPEVFKAIELVPFPASNVRNLADDFPPDMETEKLQKSLQNLGVIWTLRSAIGLNETLAREYFAALPQLMKNFQKDVQVDLLDAELAKRLPKGYAQGYLNIR